MLFGIDERKCRIYNIKFNNFQFKNSKRNAKKYLSQFFLNDKNWSCIDICGWSIAIKFFLRVDIIKKKHSEIFIQHNHHHLYQKHLRYRVMHASLKILLQFRLKSLLFQIGTNTKTNNRLLYILTIVWVLHTPNAGQNMLFVQFQILLPPFWSIFWPKMSL